MAAFSSCSVITDLIQEAKETKDAIEETTGAMKSTAENSQQREEMKNDAMQMTNNFESNLFEFNGESAPPSAAPAPALDMYSQAPASVSNKYSQSPAPNVYGQVKAPKPQPTEEGNNTLLVQTVSSDAEEAKEKEENNDDAAELFSNEHGGPAPIPESSWSQAPTGQPAYQAPPTPSRAPASQQMQQQYQEAPQQYQAPPTPQLMQPPAYSHPQSAQPSPSIARPGAVGSQHHPRQSSLGFDVGSLMGGSAQPLPESGDSGFSPAARTKSSSADFGYEDEEMFQQVEELKRKAESAAQTARDAEATHQRMMNEADELRADADKAEANARSLKAAAAEKKSGRFGRKGGDKKKLNVSTFVGTKGPYNQRPMH